MSGTRSKTVYILNLDEERYVTGTDTQVVTGTDPVLRRGQLLVTLDVYRKVSLGLDRYERFRYVGGDLVTEGPDVTTMRRVAAARIQKAASEALSSFTFSDASAEQHTVKMTDNLLGRISLAISVHRHLSLVTESGAMVKLSPHILKHVAKCFLDKQESVMETMRTGMRKLATIKVYTTMERHVDSVCKKFQEM